MTTQRRVERSEAPRSAINPWIAFKLPFSHCRSTWRQLCSENSRHTS
jgi:hypothetical protein